jgi:23S rRNA (pseudouridine1915-N3)-methyltransferase
VKWTVLAVGRARPPYADDLDHYARLLTKQARVEVVELREDEQIARRIPDRAWVCLLDAGGRQRTSEELATWVEARRQGGRDVCFVIGGPYGTDLDRYDDTLSLGPMTLPHLLARVVLLEQLFRAHKILAGEPYHH